MNENGESTRHDADYPRWMRPGHPGSQAADLPFDQELAWTQDIHDAFVDENTAPGGPKAEGSTPFSTTPEWAATAEFATLMRGYGGECIVAE